MGYFRPSNYAIENAIKEATRYDGGIYVGDYYITKDHGDYIEICIDADNDNGHISFDLFFDENGCLTKWEKHK